MKNNKILLVSMMILIAMASCNKLKEPYIIESIVSQSDTIALEAADTANFDGKVVVLLEDYTGVKCVNCPGAAEIAANLQTQYGEHLVVLGVHPNNPGNMSQQSPSGGFPDFRTDDGKTWNDYYNIAAYPSGTVNRTGSVLGAPQWTTAVNEIMGNDAPVRLIVKTLFDDATRELKISVHSKFLQNVESNDVRLTICMMEDNIIGKQVVPTSVNPAGYAEDYVHRHVFRGTADGQVWGNVLDENAETIAAGRNFITNMKFKVSTDYNADEFYIVAFISDNNTKEVLMTAETKIK